MSEELPSPRDMQLRDVLDVVEEHHMHKSVDEMVISDGGTVKIPFNHYELLNLLSLFDRLDASEHDNGDWFNEIPWKLRCAYLLSVLSARMSHDRTKPERRTSNHGDTFNVDGTIRERGDE